MVLAKSTLTQNDLAIFHFESNGLGQIHFDPNDLGQNGLWVKIEFAKPVLDKSTLTQMVLVKSSLTVDQNGFDQINFGQEFLGVWAWNFRKVLS